MSVVFNEKQDDTVFSDVKYFTRIRGYRGLSRKFRQQNI